MRLMGQEPSGHRKGTRKYNKDAFIVIKNRSRNPWVPSQAPVDKTEEA